MTMLTSTEPTDVDTGLLTLTLHTSDDGIRWSRTVFEGESPAYIDAQATEFIASRPANLICIDEDSTHWDLFPSTFGLLLESPLMALA